MPPLAETMSVRRERKNDLDMIELPAELACQYQSLWNVRCLHVAESDNCAAESWTEAFEENFLVVAEYAILLMQHLVILQAVQQSGWSALYFARQEYGRARHCWQFLLR